MIGDNNEERLVDWSPVRQTCRAALDDLPMLSTTVTSFIRKTVPAYLAVPEDDHRLGVEYQLRIRLTALSQRRPLSHTELAAASELAASRASQGIPIDALIAAHQAGDREIWRIIVERKSTKLALLMPELGRMLFTATSAATEVMARAHSQVARDIDGGRITLAHQLLDLLENPASYAEATLAASRLGFDPAGDFVGCAWLPTNTAAKPSHEIASSLLSESLDLVVRAVGEGWFEIIAQAVDAERLLQHVTVRPRGGRLGIGLPRRGVAGAATSLADARMALHATSSKRPTVRFSDHWLDALALTEGDRIKALTQQAIDVAVSQPHLAETVLAFADSHMSIATTAQRVHLHANSVTYRLNRWATLTSWDPRTFDGLAKSVVACHQADGAA